MIEEPSIRVVARHSQSLRLELPPRLHTSTANYLKSKIEQLLETSSGPNVALELQTEVIEHVGLGSKTSVVLAALTAASLATNRHLPRSTLQRLSGRGGASGIGVHGFFSGGFLVDSGRKGRVPLLPSSLHHPVDVPTLTLRIAPPDWKITLVLPAGKRKSGALEAEFFRSVTPISRTEVLEQLALVYHGLVPALIEGNLEDFGEALHAYSQLGFKAREISQHGNYVIDTMTALRKVSPCVGMSSMGPLVFAITKDRIPPEMQDLLPNATILRETVCSTSGYRVNYA